MRLPRALQTQRLDLEAQSTVRFDQWLALERARREPGHYDISDDEAWLRLLSRAGCWADFGYGFYFLFDHQSGRLIGEAGFQRRRRGLGATFDGRPEAAWAITERAQSQGLALEAMSGILIAYDAMIRGPDARAAGAVALIDVTNKPSSALARNLGFEPFEQRRYQGTPHVLYERLGCDRNI